MDLVSSAVIALNNPVLDIIATTIHNDVLFIFLLLMLVFATERNRPKLGKILLAGIVVVILALLIKNTLNVERPCSNERFVSLCEGYAFPSVHTAIAFTIAAAFLQKRTYPIYAFFALLVAFTRIYLGVHSFFDIVGGMAVGVIGYYLVDLTTEKPTRYFIDRTKEKSRQYFHIVLGLLLLTLFLAAGRSAFLILLFTAIVLGSFLANFYFLGQVKQIDFFRDRFERRGVKMMGIGSALYLLGIILLSVFLQENAEIAGGILLFGLGDGAATIFGLNGKRPLPWNNKKTVEGTIAFFVAGLPAYFFIGILALPLSALCAIIETLPLPIDDNISVPIAITTFFLVI